MSNGAPVAIRQLTDALQYQATHRGQLPALDLLSSSFQKFEDRVLSWRELSAVVSQLAHYLRQRFATVETGTLNSHAIASRPRLGHVIQNDPSDILIALACPVAGLVEVPIDQAAGEDFQQACFSAAKAALIRQDEKRALCCAAIDAVLAGTITDRGPLRSKQMENEASLILWTSGTASRPKGVVLSAVGLCLNAQAKWQAVPQVATDRRLAVLSIAHAYARTCDLGTWLLSGSQLTIDRGYEGWLQQAPRVQPTLCNLVPSLAQHVHRQDRIPASLRWLGCGGAAMSEDQFQAWSERGVSVIQGYGLTETGPVIASQSPQTSVPLRCGHLVDHWQSRLRDEVLQVRGPANMLGYLDEPELTCERIDDEGWLNTGDRVRVCQQSGQFEVLGRADDQITLANGFSLDPLLIERSVAAVAGVRAAVVQPDSSGRHIKLWVELESEIASLPRTSIEQAMRQFPAWQHPQQLQSFTVPNNLQAEIYNFKGGIKRRAMYRYLDSVDVS